MDWLFYTRVAQVLSRPADLARPIELSPFNMYLRFVAAQCCAQAGRWPSATRLAKTSLVEPWILPDDCAATDVYTEEEQCALSLWHIADWMMQWTLHRYEQDADTELTASVSDASPPEPDEVTAAWLAASDCELNSANPVFRGDCIEWLEYATDRSGGNKIGLGALRKGLRRDGPTVFKNLRRPDNGKPFAAIPPTTTSAAESDAASISPPLDRLRAELHRDRTALG